MHLRCAILLTTALLVAFSPAEAAVRQCREIVSSDIANAATELEAKKKAIDQWHAKAAKLGSGMDSWRLAADKALKCFPKNGAFECVAFGRPCVIRQSPKAPLPTPGGQPAGKGVGI